MTCSKSDIDSAEKFISCMKTGGVAIVPTDTVYGFSAVVDIEGRPAYKSDSRIRRIKGRDEGKPLIQLISAPEDFRLFSDDRIPDMLLEKWPGPLTVIVNVKKHSPYLDDFGTVALRCPGDPWLRSAIAEIGAPIFSTSVNRSGFPVLDSILEIEKEFSGDVDLLVCDGDKKDALPSTIVSMVDGELKILRRGAVEI